MEDIFVVKRCNKIIIHGRRAGESQHEPAESSSWFRINDTRTGGFIGDGYDLKKMPGANARLNAASCRDRRDNRPADAIDRRGLYSKQLTDQRPNGRELAARGLFAASQRFV
jgi:hypothetical protein